MFDASSNDSSDCMDTPEPRDAQQTRRQYTLKGIEAETISLMRNAANKEGMKIGSWVSIRMKEAAERALSEKPELVDNGKALGVKCLTRDPNLDIPDYSAILKAIGDLKILIESYNVSTKDKIQILETEIIDINKSQRSILRKIIDSDI